MKCCFGSRILSSAVWGTWPDGTYVNSERIPQGKEGLFDLPCWERKTQNISNVRFIIEFYT